MTHVTSLPGAFAETILQVAENHPKDDSEIKSVSNATFNVANVRIGNTKTHIDTEGFHEMSSMCPGAAEYLSDQSEPAIFRVSVSDCGRPGYDPRSRHGVVYGVCNDSTTFCQFLVQVPHGMNVRAKVKLLPSKCSRRWTMNLYNIWPFAKTLAKPYRSSCESLVHPVILSTTNQMFLSHYSSPMLHIQLEAVPSRLKVVHTSDFGGYVTLCMPQEEILRDASIRSTLQVPHGLAVMINFAILRTGFGCFQAVHLVWKEEDSRSIERKRVFKSDFDRSVIIFQTSVLAVNVIHVLERGAHFTKSCLKIPFSFHPKSNLPQRLSNDLFNCSVAYYWRFQQHLDCNLKVECEDGRDETGHCPFSSPACQGWVASRGKCYRLFIFNRKVKYQTAVDECLRRGLKMASIKTSRELEDFVKIFLHRNDLVTMIGLVSGLRWVPFMYRYFYRWSDNTMIYNMYHIRHFGTSEPSKNVVYHRYFGQLSKNRIGEARDSRSVSCEKHGQGEQLYQNQSVPFPDAQPFSAFRYIKHGLIRCPEGHMTHSFLSCDPKSRCGQAVCTFVNEARSVTEELSVTQSTGNMYTCSNDVIPYTLVCDFRRDCPDGSDESFCQHSSCNDFVCSNGQCVSSHKRCNNIMDCFDSSDESNCPLGHVEFRIISKQQQQLLINLDGEGYFTQKVMNISESCPETHYQCNSEWIYCLPVYTRCNGYGDCVYHEDERDCDSVTCPGFYRCRDSTVCVHADHLCDGWPQCPQHDDEWLCNMTCPAQCLCQGHAFLCPQPFSAHSFSQLRYLDAHGSKMTPSDCKNNNYLIYLNLVNCFLRNLHDMNFPNLQILDLGSNQMTSIVMNTFIQLKNLQFLSLRGNPLLLVTSTASHRKQRVLQNLDLSGTRLDSFDSRSVRHFPGLLFLNISFSSLRSIGPGGFQHVPYLQEVDMRGHVIHNISGDIFYGLGSLSHISASDYRICCKDLLSKKFSSTQCKAPPHFLSSCDNLLLLDVHRIMFWFISIFSNVGHVACFVRHCVAKSIFYGSSIIVFIGSLQCANMCMGIYASIIAVAHEAFRGDYFHHEDRWRHSVTCKLAGFLSLLSCEVSVFTILLLTLDHLIVVCFPPSAHRFSRRSAAVACGLTWFVGLLLASIPLLPALSHWGNYGQTAICSLMLQDKLHYNKEFGLHYVTVILNSFICLMVSVSHVCIYKTIPRYHLFVSSSRNPAYRSVDLVMKIAVTDSIAWILITTSSALTLTGVTGSEKVNVAMAVMVLPLNSALNPLLCLWHALACKWQQEQEQRLLRILKLRAASVPAKATTPNREQNGL